MNAVLLMVLLSPFAPAPGPEPPGGGQFYKAPEAVFDAFEKAHEKKDYKTLVDCLAPESRKEYAADLVTTDLLLKKIPLPGVAAARKPVQAVLDKYGLTDPALAGVTLGRGDEASMKSARDTIAKLIKKPEQFAVEMLAAQQKMREARGFLLPRPTKKLAGVKAVGKKATAVVILEYGPGAQLKKKIAFLKGPNGWRLVPSYSPADDVGALLPRK